MSYSVWSGDVWMGVYEAATFEEAIQMAVEEGGGSEMDYDAMLVDTL